MHSKTHPADIDNGTDVMTSIDQDLNQKMAVRQRHDVLYKIKADDLQRHLPEPQQRAMALAREKGGSSTLNTIPVQSMDFSLMPKQIFMTTSTFAIVGHWKIYQQHAHVVKVIR